MSRSSFGASAPANVLYEKFGITAEAVAGKVKALLEKLGRVKWLDAGGESGEVPLAPPLPPADLRGRGVGVDHERLPEVGEAREEVRHERLAAFLAGHRAPIGPAGEVVRP